MTERCDQWLKGAQCVYQRGHAGRHLAEPYYPGSTVDWANPEAWAMNDRERAALELVKAWAAASNHHPRVKDVQHAYDAFLRGLAPPGPERVAPRGQAIALRKPA